MSSPPSWGGFRGGRKTTDIQLCVSDPSLWPPLDRQADTSYAKPSNCTCKPWTPELVFRCPLPWLVTPRRHTRVDVFSSEATRYLVDCRRLAMDWKKRFCYMRVGGEVIFRSYILWLKTRATCRTSRKLHNVTIESWRTETYLIHIPIHIHSTWFRNSIKVAQQEKK